MGELLVHNLDDSVAAATKAQARLTPEEKIAISREIRSRQTGISGALNSEDIRDGLS